MGNDIMVSRKEDKLEQYIRKISSAKNAKTEDKPSAPKTAVEHLQDWSDDQSKLVGKIGTFNG